MPKKTLAPSVTARDPKGLKFMSIVEAAYNKVGLSEEEAQRVNEASGLADLVSGFIVENRSDRFKDEEVRSNYTYPSGYKVKGIVEQVATLRQLFPEIKDATFDVGIAVKSLPLHAEAWFAIPRWEKIAPTYGEAVDRVLATIKSKRTFYNCREGQTGPAYLRQHAKTVEAFQKLGDEQKDHDILIVPCQFGLRHRGRSVRRAREVMVACEFGLSTFAVGCMLLIHPEREVKWEQLHVDCAGDEYSPGAGGGFALAPLFYVSDGRVKFGARWVVHVNDHYGSVSAFPSE